MSALFSKMMDALNGREEYMMDCDCEFDKMGYELDYLREKIKQMKEEEMAEGECSNPFWNKPKKPVRVKTEVSVVTKPEVPVVTKPVEVIAIPPVLPGGIVIVTYPKGYTTDQISALGKKIGDEVKVKVILLPEGVGLTSLSAGELIAMGLTQIEKVTLPDDIPEAEDGVLA